MYQEVLSADLMESPVGSQLQELNPQETLLTDSQKRDIPDSQETSLSGKETLVSHRTAMDRRQRIRPGDNQDALSGGQLATPDGHHRLPDPR